MKKAGLASQSGRSDGGEHRRSAVRVGATADAEVVNPSRKPGRPRAKHSDKENYAQMSLYIRREIRNKTKVRLFEQGLEFSTLVERLLEGWLEGQDGFKGLR